MPALSGNETILESHTITFKIQNNMPTAVPVITCGDNERDATNVNKAMGPEYDVLYSGFRLPSTLQEVPLILSGKPPPPQAFHTQVGPNKFDVQPLAVAIGGGYDDGAFEKLYSACISTVGGKERLGVVFLRADNELTEKLFAEGKGPVKYGDGYGTSMMRRLKAKLAEIGLKTDARLEEIKDVSSKMTGEIVWF